MNRTKNQHYVPEVYLRFFADAKGDFHELDLIWGRIQNRNVSGVCYRHNMYDVVDPQLRQTFGFGDDVKYLEDNAFKWENYIADFFSIFTQRHPVIIPSKALHVIEIYLRIKQRNPHYTKILDSDEKMSEIYKSVVDTTYDQVKEILNQYHPTFDFTKLANEFIERDKANPDRLKNVQLRGIVDTLTYQSQNFIDTAKLMFLMNFIVIQAGQSDFFVTSDNPGYTMKRIGSGDDYGIFNLDLRDFHQVFFPLNSKQALLFKDFNHNHTPQIIRPIQYADLSSEEVMRFNLGSHFCTNGKMFCEDRDYLKSFRERLLSLDADKRSS